MVRQSSRIAGAAVAAAVQVVHGSPRLALAAAAVEVVHRSSMLAVAAASAAAVVATPPPVGTKRRGVPMGAGLVGAGLAVAKKSSKDKTSSPPAGGATTTLTTTFRNAPLLQSYTVNGDRGLNGSDDDSGDEELDEELDRVTDEDRQNAPAALKLLQLRGGVGVSSSSEPLLRAESPDLFTLNNNAATDFDDLFSLLGGDGGLLDYDDESGPSFNNKHKLRLLVVVWDLLHVRFLLLPLPNLPLLLPQGLKLPTRRCR